VERTHGLFIDRRQPAGICIMISGPDKRATEMAMTASVGATILETLPDVLSIIVALLSIMLLALRIWESETVKRWRGKK